MFPLDLPPATSPPKTDEEMRIIALDRALWTELESADADGIYSRDYAKTLEAAKAYYAWLRPDKG